MPTYQFEAMDSTGKEIKDVVEALNEEEAQTTIKQMGYFVTKIALKKDRKSKSAAAAKRGKTFALGGVKSHVLTTFTRQLSILQDAGLPILRSLKILETQAKPGALKNSLIDVCDDIEGGLTLSEALAKSPKTFDRLFVNMVKAGEAGGALEIILQRLADFRERSDSLKRKVKGALTYPICVVVFATLILAFIMIKIVPSFEKIFSEFEIALPQMTVMLMNVSNAFVKYWYLLPGIPFAIYMMVKLAKKFKHGRIGWDLFIIKVPIFGQLVEKNIVARTMRTLGTLVGAGVPIIEAFSITRETAGNAIFEDFYDGIIAAIKDGESIAVPMKANCTPPFHPVAAFWWFFFIGGPIGLLIYMLKMKQKIVDDMVVNMVDVGEETGELDRMLYKVADVYDEQVAVVTDSLMSLMEPLLIIVLGAMVGFIVIALFLPLISLISNLSSA